MITDVLVEHPWLTPGALVCMVAVAPLLGRWLLGRVVWAWGLAALSAVPLVALTLTPVGVLVNRGCTLQWALPTLGRVEQTANVVLFVAPVFLCAIALRRPLSMFLAGSAVSAAIEVVQAFLPGRACDTGDWLNNSLGALIGAALAFAVLYSARRPDGNGQARGTVSATFLEP